MAKISTGQTYRLTAQQAHAARLLSEGKPLDEIAQILFDCRTEDGVTFDEAKVKSGKAKIRKWQKQPQFVECYRDIIREYAFASYGKAVKKIDEQIDNSNDWLANKAANDILTRFTPAVMGEEDKEVVVKIEGMPALGTPDAEEG